MAKAPKARLVTKKKQWVKILAPKAFGSMELGETYVGEKREAIGKFISVNIMNLTRTYKRQNIEVTFKVTGLHDDKAVTEFFGYRMVPSSIKRVVRRGKNKVADSFVAKTADNRLVKIKPLLVTRAKAKGSIQTALRLSLRQHISKLLSKVKLEDFARDLVGHKIQKTMFDAAKKVYPLSVCEIRWAHVTTEKRPAEKVEEEKAEETPEEEPTEEIKEEIAAEVKENA